MKKCRILLVDNSKVFAGFLISCMASLAEDLEFSIATTVGQADELMKTMHFDCALIDVKLGEGVSGIDIAGTYRERYPDLAIINISTDATTFFGKNTVADDRLVKEDDFRAIPEVIRNVIWHKSPQAAWKRGIVGRLAEYRDEIEARYRKKSSDGTEVIHGVTKDGKNLLSWVVYDYPWERKEGWSRRVIIVLTSSIGCAFDCEFCRSGKRKYVRPFTAGEMISQVLHGLESSRALAVWKAPGSTVLDINWTAEGDIAASSWENFENGCKTVQILSEKLTELKPGFIMTTVGLKKNLERYLATYAHLPINFYWSINFSEEKRTLYMPRASRESVAELKEIFQKIGERSRRMVTAAYFVGKGINDSPEDAQWLISHFGGNETFEVKLMPIQPNSLEGAAATDMDDVHRFAELLRAGNVRCRERVIVGWEIGGSCGKTVPPSHHAHSSLPRGGR